jgi:iron complex outermembrane receptor protein
MAAGFPAASLAANGEVSAGGVEADRPPSSDSEILVTARRRDESSQDVPIALSVISGAALEAKAAFQLNQIYQEVPSLTVSSRNPRNASINIRGLGANTATSANGLDQGVGFYVDDVYYARTGQASFDLVDIERVEVLRGPQGTLFGRNTTAGAISVTTRKPSFDPSGSLELSGGNLNYFQARGSITGPLTDKLAYRLTGYVNRRGGFIEDTFQDRKVHNFRNFTVRGQLLYKPSEDLSIRVIGDYSEQKQTCCVGLAIGYITQYDNGAPVLQTFGPRVAQFGYTPLAADRKKFITDADGIGSLKMKSGGASINVQLNLGGATLTSITSARMWTWSPQLDGDDIALSIQTKANNNDKQRQFSQEFRIASSGDGPLSYVAGLYGFHQRHRNWLEVEYGRDAGEYFNAPGTRGLSALQRRQVLEGVFYRGDSLYEAQSYAAFGQVSWKIAPELELTGGLRFTHERKQADFVQRRGGGIADSLLNADQLALRIARAPAVAYYKLSESWDNLSGLATLSYKVAPDVLVYATYSRGSKSGGINATSLPVDALGNTLFDLAVVAPEKVNNYEIGLKSQFLGGKLTVNLAAFRMDIDDYQSIINDTISVPTRSYIGSVGKVRSQGIELDVKARPVEGLNLYAGGMYNPAKYASYPDAQCPFEALAPGQPRVCDLSGQRLPGAPRYSFSAGGDLTVPASDRLDAVFGADYAYRSFYYSSYNNSRYSIVDGFGLLNLRAGVRTSDGKWEATLWGRNVLDKVYFHQTGADSTGGRVFGRPADPRTYGITARHQF